MPKIMIFVNMNKRSAGDSGFQLLKGDYEISRVPAVGEFIDLGNDTEGQMAHYRVVIVVHAPKKPRGIDAEVYTERVQGTKHLAAPKGAADNAEILPEE